MADPIYIVVRLEGGNITDIDSSDPNVRVCVIDEDNIEAGDERPDETDPDDYDYPVGVLCAPEGDRVSSQETPDVG